MSDVYKMVKGDTGPQIQVTLTDEDTGAAKDLTGGTVTLHFRAVGSTTLLFSRVLALTDAANGVAVVQWGASDLDQTPGMYEGELEVTDSSGVTETLYDKLRFRIRDEIA